MYEITSLIKLSVCFNFKIYPKRRKIKAFEDEVKCFLRDLDKQIPSLHVLLNMKATIEDV